MAVGVSGGVDSAVAALTLRNSGGWASSSVHIKVLIDFSKILLVDSYLSDNGIFCSIINIGDVNSY